MFKDALWAKSAVYYTRTCLAMKSTLYQILPRTSVDCGLDSLALAEASTVDGMGCDDPYTADEQYLVGLQDRLR